MPNSFIRSIHKYWFKRMLRWERFFIYFDNCSCGFQMDFFYKFYFKISWSLILFFLQNISLVMLHCHISDSPTIFIIQYYYFQNTFIHNKNYTLNHLVRHIYLIYKETKTTASSKTILAIDTTTRSFDFMDNKGAHN